MGIFKSSVSRMYSDKRSMAVLCKTLATHGDQETLIGKFKEFDTNGYVSFLLLFVCLSQLFAFLNCLPSTNLRPPTGLTLWTPRSSSPS